MCGFQNTIDHLINEHKKGDVLIVGFLLQILFVVDNRFSFSFVVGSYLIIVKTFIIDRLKTKIGILSARSVRKEIEIRFIHRYIQ